jgi:DNA-binding transcriptional ArsR family regulator
LKRTEGAEVATAVEQLSSTFSALADPTRRAILSHLADREATVNELAEPFPVSVQAISKHLMVLEHAGLVTKGKEAQWRRCRLEATPLREVTDWLETYRRFWERRFDRLEEHLRNDGLTTGKERTDE